MGKPKETKDIVEKEFLSFPDIAADVINALLYQGRKEAEAKSLLAGPTESIYQGRKKLRNQYEDVCKFEVTNGKIRLMYLIANQTKTDGKMLLRKAGYTGGVYRSQYGNRTQKPFPVIAFVLYWGIPRWRGNRNSRRLFRHQELSEKAWSYIDEMKLHVFEMRYLPEETRKLFQSDMRIVVDFLAEGDSYRSSRKITHKAALIRMIRVLSGDTDTEDVEQWMNQQGIREEDEIKMCELFDQYERRGLARGREEGRTEGIAEGEAKGEALFASLAQSLIDSGRIGDLKKALSDQGYRRQLYIEAGLSYAAV